MRGALQPAGSSGARRIIGHSTAFADGGNGTWERALLDIPNSKTLFKMKRNKKKSLGKPGADLFRFRDHKFIRPVKYSSTGEKPEKDTKKEAASVRGLLASFW